MFSVPFTAPVALETFPARCLTHCYAASEAGNSGRICTAALQSPRPLLPGP